MGRKIIKKLLVICLFSIVGLFIINTTVSHASTTTPADIIKDYNAKVKKKYTGWCESKSNMSNAYDPSTQKAVKTKHKYYMKDGKILRGWQEINGLWYYFDKNLGYMYTGAHKIGNTYYYFENNLDVSARKLYGTMRILAYIKGSSANSNGDTVTYVYGKDGKCVSNGWVLLGPNKLADYIYVKQYKPVTGWQTICGKKYYFSKINEYDIKDSIFMTTGFKKISGNFYYFGDNGIMKTGWQKINNKWYFFNSKGIRVTGKQTITNKIYFFDEKGILRYGWQQISGKWYYFDKDKSGVALVSTSKKIGNKTYKFNAAGVCTNP